MTDNPTADRDPSLDELLHQVQVRLKTLGSTKGGSHAFSVEEAEVALLAQLTRAVLDLGERVATLEEQSDTNR